MKAYVEKLTGNRSRYASRLFMVWIVAAVFLLGSTACETAEEDQLPQEIKVAIEPRNAEIDQAGMIRITAKITPKLNSKLRYMWGISGDYGEISKHDPTFLSKEETATGSSSVDYTAILMMNRGGTDEVNVTVYDENGVKIASDSTQVTVKPHAKQKARGVVYEYLTDGRDPGRLTTIFLTAWVFDKKPGFNQYKFTVTKKPESDYVGEVGATLIFSLRGALIDRDEFVRHYKSDIFNLGDDKIALLMAGPLSENYRPGDERTLADIAKMKEVAEMGAIAEYEIEPYF